MSDKEEEEDRGQERQQMDELNETFYKEPASIPTMEEFYDWVYKQYPQGEDKYGI
jgi:hypothetical protein